MEFKNIRRIQIRLNQNADPDPRKRCESGSLTLSETLPIIWAYTFVILQLYTYVVCQVDQCEEGLFQLLQNQPVQPCPLTRPPGHAVQAGPGLPGEKTEGPIFGRSHGCHEHPKRSLNVSDLFLPIFRYLYHIGIDIHI